MTAWNRLMGYMQHKIDEIMQLLPDQEMVWALVKERARHWSAMVRQRLRGRFGIEDDAEQSPAPHKHADLDPDHNDAYGIDINQSSPKGHEKHASMFVAT